MSTYGEDFYGGGVYAGDPLVMNFSALKDEVRTNAFKAADDGQIARWINAAAGQLWALEPWPWKKAQVSVTISVGSSVVTVPTDFGVVLGFWDENGEELTYLPQQEWNESYYGETSPGDPVEYTVDYTTLDGDSLRQLLVGPIPQTGSTTYRLLYERLWGHYHLGQNFAAGDMADDTDIPPFPSETHYTIVWWARMLGKIARSDPTAALDAQARDEGLQTMRQNYLAEQRGTPGQWGSYNPNLVN